MYDDIFDAKNACDHLSGFNVCGRYIVVLYYQTTKVRSPALLHGIQTTTQILFSFFFLSLSFVQAFAKVDLTKKKEDLDKMKQAHGL